MVSSCPPTTEFCSQALALPDLLTLVFKFLARENSVYPCLFVSKLWNSVVSRVLWINLSFSEEAALGSFLRTTSELSVNVFPSCTRSLRCFQLKNMLTLPTLPVEKSFTRLERLEFFICHNLELNSIYALIKLNPSLTQIRFPGCIQVDDSVLFLLAKHCPNLEHLDLRACSKVTDHGIMAIARSCTWLNFLNIGRTEDGERITDRSFMEIAINTKIRTIGASGCDISDQGLLVLIQHRKGRLERLSLNNCSLITDHSMAQISRCVKLSVLEVKGCTSIRNMKIFQDLHRRRVFLELCPILQARFRQA